MFGKNVQPKLYYYNIHFAFGNAAMFFHSGDNRNSIYSRAPGQRVIFIFSVGVEKFPVKENN
jgi:hypothetical protein